MKHWQKVIYGENNSVSKDTFLFFTFCIPSLLPTFFQQFISMEMCFLNWSWPPSGLDYWSLLTAAYLTHSKGLSTTKVELLGFVTNSWSMQPKSTLEQVKILNRSLVLLNPFLFPSRSLVPSATGLSGTWPEWCRRKCSTRLDWPGSSDPEPVWPEIRRSNRKSRFESSFGTTLMGFLKIGLFLVYSCMWPLR